MILRRIRGNESGGTFLVMMTTLNMLLLAFFIVLNSIAVVDEKRKLNALGSLLGTFGLLSSGVHPSLSKEQKQINPRSVEMDVFHENIMKMLQRIERIAMEKNMGAYSGVQFGVDGALIYLMNRIAFVEGKAVLQPNAREMLSDVALLLSRVDGEINIIGYASPGSYKAGPYLDDWALSYARAGVAARHLISSAGIKPRRISIAGYGFTKPLFTGRSKDAERFDDRLELVLDRTRI